MGSPSAPSLLRAWLALVGLSIRRQARMRQMVWIALGLLGLVLVSVLGRRFIPNRPWIPNRPQLLSPAATEARDHDPWGQFSWRFPRRDPRMTYGDYSVALNVLAEATPIRPEAAAIVRMAAASFEAILQTSRFQIFASRVLFSLFVSFLLPLWSLSFATEAFGGEREARSMVWLLTRPLPRWSIYLAKYLGVLPWVLGFNIGGFALICLAAGEPGRFAFRLFWPGVAVSGVAFASLFHLFGAAVRRPTVVALGYSFFLETILGDMPGLLKRVSVTFYTRCIMFDTAAEYGLTPERPSVYQPVSGETAWLVLISATVVLLAAGMWWFSRAEYREET
jgi:ABC-type transport system involved in multi-copper enzyme maturation permease subunit